MSRNETISLLELFTDIDESYITEAAPMKNMVQPFFAEPVKKSRKPIFAIAGIAACFAVVFAIGTVVKNNMGIEITQPPVNSAEPVTEETTTEAVTEESETKPQETEPQGVEITDENGVKFTLYGQPWSSDKLNDYTVKVQKGYDDAFRYFVVNSSIPDKEEIIDLFNRSDIVNGDLTVEANYGRYNYDPEIGLPSAYIMLDNNMYMESGISYDSYYNEMCSIFTKETADKVMHSSHLAPVSYNGELWYSAGGKSGDIACVNTEYELVSLTDTEIEIYQTRYYAYPDDLFCPWWEDMYSSYKLRSKFVKTDEGWRIEVAGHAADSITGEGIIEGTHYESPFTDMERPIKDALDKYFYRPENLAPVKEPWTEELVQEAWDLLLTHFGVFGEYSKNTFTDTYYADINGDNIPELFMVSDQYGICIFRFKNDGEVTLFKKGVNVGDWRFMKDLYADEVPVSPEDIKDARQIGEEFLDKRHFTVFTDEADRYYVLGQDWRCPTGPAYTISEILLDVKPTEAIISPLYIWGRLGSSDGEIYDGTVKYKKIDTDEKGSLQYDENNECIYLEASEQEIEEFLSNLNPAQ